MSEMFRIKDKHGRSDIFPLNTISRILFTPEDDDAGELSNLRITFSTGDDDIYIEGARSVEVYERLCFLYDFKQSSQ